MLKRLIPPAIALALLMGCAQNTETVTPAKTAQKEQVGGTTIDVDIWNGAREFRTDESKPGLTMQGAIAAKTEDGNTVALDKAHVDTLMWTGGSLGTLEATYAVVFANNTLSGGDAAGTQTASTEAAGTVSAEQPIEAGVSVPVGVALPGGIADVTGAGGTGSATATDSSQNQLDYLQQRVEAQGNQITEILETLKGLLNPPASQPVSEQPF